MIRNGTQFPKLNINFLLNTGGLGDNIAALPALRYIKDKYPWITPYVYVPDYFLPIVKNMMPDIIARPFSKGEKLFNGKWPARQTMLKGHDSLSTHLVDYNFHALANKQVEDKDKNYLKLNLDWIHTEKFKLPKEYVTIATGFTAPIRKFPSHTVNLIIDYLNGKQIPIVFLGNHQTSAGAMVNDIIGDFSQEINYNKGIDLIDKTSLLEAGKIIANSKCLLGIDNGLMHLAGCSNTKIVGGYTSVSPELRLPYRDGILGKNCYIIEPPDSQPEKYIQSRLDFVYDHDFKFSFAKNDDLVNSLTSEMFINQLEKLL